MSNSKKLPYFFNRDTQESRWEAPSELTKEEVDELPGAKEYLVDFKPLPSGQHIRASHLLIKHKDSRRPSSWKEVRDNSRDPSHSPFPNASRSPRSLGPRTKRSRFCESIKRRSMLLPTSLPSLASLPRYTRTVPHTKRVETWACFLTDRCKSRLRKRRLRSRRGRSAIS